LRWAGIDASAHLLDLLDLVWHLAGFLAPAVGTGLIAASLAKGLFGRDLQAVPWRRLAAGSTVVCAAVLVCGLVASGHDGRMATYAAMVVACGVALWWIGFRRVRR